MFDPPFSKRAYRRVFARHSNLRLQQSFEVWSAAKRQAVGPHRLRCVLVLSIIRAEMWRREWVR